MRCFTFCCRSSGSSGASRNSGAEVCAPGMTVESEQREEGEGESLLSLLLPLLLSFNSSLLLLPPFLQISLPPPLSIPQTPSPLFLSACMVAALPPKTAFKLHLLHLLRARLLHFVNSLNNYLMTRVGRRSLAVSCYTVLHNVTKCAVSVTTS